MTEKLDTNIIFKTYAVIFHLRDLQPWCDSRNDGLVGLTISYSASSFAVLMSEGDLNLFNDLNHQDVDDFFESLERDWWLSGETRVWLQETWGIS